jgi:hypothetical protein
VNRDEFLDETFVFKGTDVNLPPGITKATVTGSLINNGGTFETSETVFNRTAAFYSPGARQEQLAKWARQGSDRPDLPALIASRESRPGPDVHFTSPTPSSNAIPLPIPHPQVLPQGPAMPRPIAITPNAAMNTGPVISIKKREPTIAGQRTTPQISPQLHASMNHFLQQGDFGGGLGGHGAGMSPMDVSGSAS